MTERGGRLLRLADAVLYALVLTAALAAVSIVVSFPLGGGWVGVKLLLFVFGLLVFGVGSLQLRPAPPWREERRFSLETDEETRFQALVHRLPPLRWRDLPPEERWSVALRLVLAGLSTLGLSFLLEAVFGVGVP